MIHGLELFPINFCDQCGTKLNKDAAVGEFTVGSSHIFIQCSKCKAWTEWTHQTGTIKEEYLQEWRQKYGF